MGAAGVTGGIFVTMISMFQDPAIASREPAGTYPPFDRGNARDVWVKTSDGVTPIEGQVMVNSRVDSFSTRLFGDKNVENSNNLSYVFGPFTFNFL